MEISRFWLKGIGRGKAGRGRAAFGEGDKRGACKGVGAGVVEEGLS